MVRAVTSRDLTSQRSPLDPCSLGTAATPQLDDMVEQDMTPQASFSTIMKLWLPRTFSHEVDHSVRFLAGPGYGPSLLERIISEGISSAFDTAAFPGTPDPWDRVISHSQECALWKQAQPLLGQTDLYNQWFLSGNGIPYWTGFTIGYDIVADYHQRHPDASWSAITAASAATILAGSHYQPCSS
jgi:uncharacterized protein YjaZ